MSRFLILIFALISLNYFAQNAKIKGRIISKEGSTPMSFAMLSLNGNLNKNADANGNFYFEKLTTGQYYLTAYTLGYDKYEEVVYINNENDEVELKPISLEASSIQISEVVISVPASNYSSKYEGSNFLISAKDIELTKPIGTEEILKKVTGVNVSGDMGISNRLNVGIRGSYPRRSVNILLMEDGTPIAPAPYLAPEAYYNPPSDRLDGIEILKGADILTYGSNTMYGAINYITKKPPVKPTLGLTLTGGENGYHSQYLTYGGTWNKMGAELQILNKGFGGFQDNSSAEIFNTSLKLYTELNRKSSFYLKLNYHQENAKASYSALTPYTFKTDPRQNPFDADDLFTKRYAIDFIHNYKPTESTMLSSKIYVSQFQRDWWRQENTVISGSVAANYLKEEIINDRYSYLQGQTFGPNDYIRVGRLVNGKEQARARNRTFRFGGFQETFKYNLDKELFKMNLEITARIHAETFNNLELRADSSRFARSGVLDRDHFYELFSYSGAIKDKFTVNKFSVTPYLRYELVEMRSFDRLAISKMTNNNGTRTFGSLRNQYSSLIPGISTAYNFLKSENNNLTFFAGLYKGYTAPTGEVGFLHVEEGGNVKKPDENNPINRLPEISLNHEAGIRGEVFKNLLGTQLVYFNNKIQNFYSAGRNEAFQTLGAANIYGLEASVQLNLHKLMRNEKHNLVLNFSGTFMRGKILSGKLIDSDLLRARHTPESRAELVEKINKERTGYDVYFTGAGGKDSLVTRNMELSDFSQIKRLDLNFGKDKIKNNTVPYLPPSIVNIGIMYSYKGFSIGGNVNFVAAQYTDYLNIKNETAEGAIGILPSFKTIDVNLAYSCADLKNRYLSGCTFFIAGKNITNEIYMASRLHRLSSGIMPGGFRQINAGIKFNL